MQHGLVGLLQDLIGDGSSAGRVRNVNLGACGAEERSMEGGGGCEYAAHVVYDERGKARRGGGKATTDGRTNINACVVVVESTK